MRLSLAVVGGEAVAHPGPRIALRMPCVGAYLGEHLVIGLGIASEVLLDAGEHRRDDLLARQDKRLEAARHASVAIPEGVDHHEVEVGHRGLYENRRLVCSELVEHAHDQVGDKLRIRALVDDLARLFAPDEDRPGSPASWALAQVVLQHHEVQSLQQPFVDVDARILRQLQHVGHRVPVADERELRILGRVEGRLAVDGGDHVIEAGVIALDAVRRLHCSREGHAAQAAIPPLGSRDAVMKLLAQLPYEG